MCLFPWHRRPGSHVPYKSQIELRAASMPDAAWAVSGIPQADPGGMATPRFWHRLIAFRHVISGSLALASLNHACRNLVPPFPQRSPPSLLTTAACGGLRSTPDCRPRRALLHLSYSYASPYGPAILVTQCQSRTYAPQQTAIFIRSPRRHGEQRRRDVEAERLGGLEVDDQFEFGRLHHRQVGGLRALEDAVDIDCGRGGRGRQ